MLRPVICTNLCVACPVCKARLACKTRAITKIDEDEPPFIAIERCRGCGTCTFACDYGAIVMTQDEALIRDGCQEKSRVV